MAFAELLAQPGVVEALTIRSRVGFLALHGGLEPGTAEIARGVAAASGASCYTVCQPGGLDRHVASVDADPTATPHLACFLTHVRVLISVHGYRRAGTLRHAVLVGGANRRLAGDLADALRGAIPDYQIVDDLAAMPPGLRGLDPRNPVNRVEGGGAQLELPHRVRAIGAYSEGPDGERHREHRRRLVDALAVFASTRTR